MKFEFVDNNFIDGPARRRIRSHAARGRNAGKKLSRPSKRNLKAVTTRPSEVQHQTAQRAVRSVTEPLTGDSVAHPLVGSLYSAISSTPAHLHHQAGGSGGHALVQEVISFLVSIRHAPELDEILDYSSEPRSKWVQPLFFDEAYFHGAMAVFLSKSPRSSTSPHHSDLHQDTSRARMRHHCFALRLLNSRLSGEHAASNQNLIAVIVLSMYERQQGEHRRGLVHLDGLERLMQLRGGVAAFIKSRPDLARKIFR
ncbi:hypothetical protein P885DRAFT_68949 [Corynascus similis CBS 632.67]